MKDKELVKQVADKLAEYFNDPIDIKCSYCDAAEAVFPIIKKAVEAERLDRPELREKLEDILIKVATESLATKPNGIQDELDQILALIPDEKAVAEEIKRELEKYIYATRMPGQVKIMIHSKDWDEIFKPSGKGG